MFSFACVFGVLAAGGLMEMPNEPSLEQLCADSAIIVSARAVKQCPEVDVVEGTAYRLVVFEPVEVFKGRSTLITARPSMIHAQSPATTMFSVLIATRRPSCYQVPSYAPGNTYLLFLDTQCAFAAYGRAELDSVWGERPYTDALGSRVRSIVKEQASFSLRRQSRPGDPGGIPPEAQEQMQTLTEQDRINGYSRKACYTVGGQRVGERGWWTTGRMAYERPMRHGRSHGLVRGWYPDGKLWQEDHYRNGQLHGLVCQWDESAGFSISFWLEGQNVTGEAYKQACALDPALPRYRAAASKPSSRPAEADGE